jgi:hypothetical protein
MEIKHVLIALSFLCLTACTGHKPELSSMSGRWIDDRGGSLILNSNGTFQVQSIPSTFFFHLSVPTFKGRGIWELKEDSGSWEILLHFNQIEDNRNVAYEATINVAEESKRKFYLFVWKEEEGGERYKFKKR